MLARCLPRVLVALFCASLVTASAPADAQEFVSIFDGESLQGWGGNPRFWRVEDGTIVGQTTKENPTKGNTFLCWRAGELKDFELRLKFRIDGGNSGIQFRSEEVERWVVKGYQADFDGAGNWTGSLYEERGRGIMAKRGNQVVVDETGKKNNAGQTTPEKEILATMKKGQWNTYVVKARGNHIQQWVNGKLTVDLTDNHEAGRKMCGLLALQVHAGPPMKVEFKDIQVKHFPVAADGAAAQTSDSKKVVFVAGKRSHGYGAHEHNAGCMLLAKHLQAAMPDYVIDVQTNGWPADPAAYFDGADTVVMYCDGGGGHMVNQHLDQFDQLMQKGVGVVCIHYAVETPKGKTGNAFLDWMGGYFETDWSVNPHWTANFVKLPDHPIANGVESFEINDEWYFHMRFRAGMKGVTPILTAIAPESTMRRADGPYSGNPHVRRAVAAGEPQHVAWAFQRENGGRGFGFTGGHFHWNWGDDNFRRVMLNAIVWTAHGKVPSAGVAAGSVTRVQLEENQDEDPPRRKSG